MSCCAKTLESPAGDGDVEVDDYLTASAGRILCELGSVDLRPYEELPHDHAAAALARDAVPRVLSQAAAVTRLLRSLPEMLGAPAVAENTADLDFDFEAPTPSPDADETRADLDIDAALAGLESATRSLDEIRDTCSMFTLELRNLAAHLKQARWQRSFWGMLDGCDELRAHATKAARLALRVLEGIGDRTDVTELEAARILRQRTFAFLDDVREFTNVSPVTPASDVIGRVRRLRARLSAFAAEPFFDTLRAGERLQLRELANRAETISNGAATPNAAVQLLGDAAAALELLTEFNRRELLVSYDRHLRDECLDELRAVESTAPLLAGHGWGPARAVLLKSLELRYRDPALAITVAEALESAPVNGEELQRRVHELAERLQALRV
jgi:hypothetical protein